PRPGRGCRRASTLWADRPCAGPGARAPVAGRRPAASRLWRSLHQVRLELREQLLEHVEAYRLFDRPDHVEPERFAEPEGGFEHAPVEAADNQHGTTIILFGEEAGQLDPVHPR